MAREKFTFRRAWIDGWEDMSAAERLEYLEAIVRYGLTGTRRAMSHYVRGRMVAVMRDVDEDRRKEEAMRERQRQNIAKRWHPVPSDTTEYQPIPDIPRNTKDTTVSAPYTKETRVPAHPQAYTEGVSSSLRSEDTISSSSSSFDICSGVTAAGGGRGGNLPDFVALWNEAVKAGGSRVRPIRAITEGTQRHMRLEVLLEDYGEQAVREAIARLFATPYTNGGSRIGWLPTFDWFIQPDNFQKVLEGNFYDADERKREASKPKPSAPSSEQPEAEQPTRPQVPHEMLEAWERVKQSCERVLGAQFRRTFLDYCCPWARQGDKVQIAVPTSFVREKLTEQAGTLLAAARREWGAEVQIWLTVVHGLDRMRKE